MSCFSCSRCRPLLCAPPVKPASPKNASARQLTGPLLTFVFLHFSECPVSKKILREVLPDIAVSRVRLILISAQAFLSVRQQGPLTISHFFAAHRLQHSPHCQGPVPLPSNQCGGQFRVETTLGCSFTTVQKALLGSMTNFRTALACFLARLMTRTGSVVTRIRSVTFSRLKRLAAWSSRRASVHTRVMQRRSMVQ